jgi:phospholipase C
MLTRRSFLKQSAALAGTVGGLIETIRRAAAIEPVPGSSFLDAEHVVILMQENRSFDHAFGTLRGVRGFDDPRAITLPDGNPVWVQSTAAGEQFVPFRFDMKDSRATWMGSLPHGWTDQTDARNGGRHDRWLPAKRSGTKEYADLPLTLGYYTRADIPFYYALADAFTICDQHFCSTLTGTTPNRLHLWTGTIRAMQSATSPANVRNEDVDYGKWASWPTFPERLEDAGISWKVYQNELTLESGLSEDEDAWLANFGDNPLEWFTQYHVNCAAPHRRHVERRLQELPGEIETLRRELDNGTPEERSRRRKRLADLTAKLKQYTAEAAAWSPDDLAKLPPRERRLYERAFCMNTGDSNYRRLAEITYRDGGRERRLRVPAGDVLHQFRADVEAGTLPTVSWLVSPERFSDHPCSAWYGAWYVAETLNILSRNPAVWKKTVFILTYDENDGYFDHVPPFVAPHPGKPDTGRVSKGIDTSLEYHDLTDDLKRVPPTEARGGPLGLGYRVPLLIASPWTRGGCVCSQVFDHTSVVQFLERLLTHKTGKPVREPNVNEWRRTVCGDLTAAFQSAADNGAGMPAFPPRDEFLAEIHKAQFTSPSTGGRPLTPAQIEEIRRDPRTTSLLPRQEPGARRSCPLPCELRVNGDLDADRKRFTITFEAAKERFGLASAGAAFIVYATTAGGQIRVRNYAVRPGDRVEDSWPVADFRSGRYDLRVYGPNGFFRAFTGGADDPPVCVRFTDGHGPEAGDVEIQFKNRADSTSHTFTVHDNAYRNAPVERVVSPGTEAKGIVSTQRSFGWYDVNVRVAAGRCEKRYAGRVETGRWTYSDPMIGSVPAS